MDVIKTHFNACISSLGKTVFGQVATFFVIYCLALTALFRANFNYKDDVVRVFFGFRKWAGASRYLNDLLSILLFTDTELPDISPLPQIVAVFLMAVASVILLRVLSDSRGKTLWSLRYIVAVMPLALCPYFLECFSYKFDAPFMALAMLSGIFPLLFAEKGIYCYGIVSILSLLTMCTTYQLPSGVYPMLVLFVAYERWTGEQWKGRKTFIFLATSALCYIVTLGAYRGLLVKSIPDYVQTEIPKFSELISSIIHRYLLFYARIVRDMKISWLFLLVLVVCFCWISMIRRSKKKLLPSVLLSWITIFLSSIMACGIYQLLAGLNDSVEIYKPRMMIGITPWIAIVCILSVLPSHNVKRKGEYVATFICIALSWCFFTFAYTYGNALACQKRYTQEITSALVSDLNNLDIMNSDNVKTVFLEGDIGCAPEIIHSMDNYEMLYRLIPETLGDSLDHFGIIYLRYYLSIPNIRRPSDEEIPAKYPMLKETMLYSLLGNETHLVIRFKTQSRDEQKPQNSWIVELLLPIKKIIIRR